MNSAVSSSLAALQRAEAWCDRFLEIATEPSGERLPHLRRRRCVEWENEWEGVSGSAWEEQQNDYSQLTLDAQLELDRLLPDLRHVEPDVVGALERSRKCLTDLRGAILGIQVKGDRIVVCREWFTRMQQRYRQLESTEFSAR